MTDHQPEQITNEKKFIIPEQVTNEKKSIIHERKKLKLYNTDLFQLQLHNNFD